MKGERFGRLDALRGAAIVWMVAFHFGFDLNHFGLLQPPHNFHRDALWTTQRVCIVSLFVFCAGLSQAVALQAEQGGRRFPPAFWRRWAQVAGCAVLVSAGSAWMFPRTWIQFGVLHGIAVMLILCRLAAPLRARLWPLGLLCVVLPRVVKLPLFDHPLLSWIGLVTRVPFTEDYVPVLPWLGLMLWGLAAGQWLLLHRRAGLSAALPPALQPLAVLGRWSLSVYMLHQPVLIGALMAGRQLGWW